MSSFEIAVEGAGGIAEHGASATASSRFCSGFGEGVAKLNVKAMLMLGGSGEGATVAVLDDFTRQHQWPKGQAKG